MLGMKHIDLLTHIMKSVVIRNSSWYSENRERLLDDLFNYDNIE